MTDNVWTWEVPPNEMYCIVATISSQAYRIQKESCNFQSKEFLITVLYLEYYSRLTILSGNSINLYFDHYIIIICSHSLEPLPIVNYMEQ